MTTPINLPLLAGIPDPAAGPYPAWTTIGRTYLVFDSATAQSVVWTFPVPTDYSSAPLVDLLWSGSTSTTTSHTARWGASLMAVTPETDSVDVSADSFDTQSEADDDILGTTAKRLQLLTITVSNTDSLAADDYGAVKIQRVSAHANDDLPEDAWLWAARIRYTAAA